MIWVLDASVALRWLIEDEAHVNADEALRRIVAEPYRFAVPELFAFEVFSVLNRIHPQAGKAYTLGIIPILQGGILRQPMTEGLAIKAGRFVRMGLTGYDACYAALALDLGGCWLTFDRKAHHLIEKENMSWLISDSLPYGW